MRTSLVFRAPGRAIARLEARLLAWHASIARRRGTPLQPLSLTFAYELLAAMPTALRTEVRGQFGLVTLHNAAVASDELFALHELARVLITAGRAPTTAEVKAFREQYERVNLALRAAGRFDAPREELH